MGTNDRADAPAGTCGGAPDDEARREGRRGARFHDLRRAAVSRWIMSGLTPKVVQTIAGHHDAALTLQVYAQVRGGDLPSGDALAL